MFKLLVKAILISASMLYAIVGAFAAWLMNDAYDDMIDGYIAASLEAGEDAAILKVKRRLVKIQIVIWTIIRIPFWFIKYLFVNKKEFN